MKQFQAEACVLSSGPFKVPGSPGPTRWQHRNRADRNKQHGQAPPKANQQGASTDDDQQTCLAFLPPVVGIYAAGSTRLEDPQGWPLPPCVVLQRGESLQDWMNRPVCDRSRSSAAAVRRPVLRCSNVEEKRQQTAPVRCSSSERTVWSAMFNRKIPVFQC